MAEKVKGEKGFKRGLLVLVGVLVVLFAVGLTYLYENNKPREADFYLIPQGYVGPVAVQFNQDGTPGVEKEGEHSIYRIPAEGTLNTVSAPNYGVAKDKYYYVDEQGNRTELTHGTEVHGVFLGKDEDDLSKPVTSSFFVGTEEEWQAWNRKVHEERMEKKKDEPRRYY